MLGSLSLIRTSLVTDSIGDIVLGNAVQSHGSLTSTIGNITWVEVIGLIATSLAAESVGDFVVSNVGSC
jgi:hypothetical protein